MSLRDEIIQFCKEKWQDTRNQVGDFVLSCQNPLWERSSRRRSKLRIGSNAKKPPEGRFVVKRRIEWFEAKGTLVPGKRIEDD